MNFRVDCPKCRLSHGGRFNDVGQCRVQSLGEFQFFFAVAAVEPGVSVGAHSDILRTPSLYSLSERLVGYARDTNTAPMKNVCWYMTKALRGTYCYI